MIKYFCDRCKTECEKSRATLLVSPLVIGETKKFSYDGVPSEYGVDLCPTCLNQFYRFMNKEKILDVD